VRQQFKQTAGLTDPKEVSCVGRALVAAEQLHAGASALYLAHHLHHHMLSSHTHTHTRMNIQIEAAKAAAARGLSNYMFHEAQRLATTQTSDAAAPDGAK
jgi:hypothetical protein